jgi:cell division protein FtsB
MANPRPKRRPPETPAVPNAARDTRKGNSDAALALEERKKIIKLTQQNDALKTENAKLKAQLKDAKAPAKRKKS